MIDDGLMVMMMMTIYQDPGDEVVLRGDDAVSLTDSVVDSRDSAWARHASATTRSHSQPSTPAQCSGIHYITTILMSFSLRLTSQSGLAETEPQTSGWN